MDVLRLYQDYNVGYVTEGHKHARPGFINTECPFCKSLPGSNPGYHLGWNVNDHYFTCWRCGWHPVIQTVSGLLEVSERDVRKLLTPYGRVITTIDVNKPIKVDKKTFRLPSCVEPLKKAHKLYLIKRNYDPDRLEKLWKLKSTGPISLLDKIDYGKRILIPFYWNGQLVTFDARAANDKNPLRYQACPKHREAFERKHILYGNQEKWKDTGICVEGATDVWRLGPLSFATCGIKYTPRQIRLIKASFKRVAVVFDEGAEATKQALKLVAELKFRGVDAFHVPIEGDPGAMKQSEADYLVKQLTK